MVFVCFVVYVTVLLLTLKYMQMQPHPEYDPS